MVSGFVSIDMTPSISADFSEIPVLFFFQKFGTIRADLIEQMRFKQRLKVIQTLEDTTKRNVVSLLRNGMWPSVPILPCIPPDSQFLLDRRSGLKRKQSGSFPLWYFWVCESHGVILLGTNHCDRNFLYHWWTRRTLCSFQGEFQRKLMNVQGSKRVPFFLVIFSCAGLHRFVGSALGAVGGATLSLWSVGFPLRWRLSWSTHSWELGLQ